MVEALLHKSIEIQDAVMELSRDVSALANKVDLNPEELAAIEARLEELYTLKRRYGPSLEQVLDALEEGRRRLQSVNEAAQARREFAEKRKKLDAELAESAQALSAARRKCADAFIAKCRAKLELIGFKGCRMEARFEEVRPGATGMDKLELHFSANVGEEMRPLRKIASSGELSRVMLAMKTVLADADAVPTVVFDEIDMNIGGETANRVGEELHDLGRHRQILCISHLVQVAARADAHFLAEKHTESNRTVSTVRRLDDVKAELARMLGGGESSLRHAAALLKELSRA
jgi:DNA repair protein RecN (Recombination protein N)